jgi:hypothetical protein
MHKSTNATPEGIRSVREHGAALSVLAHVLAHQLPRLRVREWSGQQGALCVDLHVCEPDLPSLPQIADTIGMTNLVARSDSIVIGQFAGLTLTLTACQGRGERRHTTRTHAGSAERAPVPAETLGQPEQVPGAVTSDAAADALTNLIQANAALRGIGIGPRHGR